MDESAIGFAAFPGLLVSFNYPRLAYEKYRNTTVLLPNVRSMFLDCFCPDPEIIV